MALMPNFFVIGAPKAGTTSLYKHLYGHPDICFSPIKEPNHFCADLHLLAGSSSLNDRLPLNIENYLSSKIREPVQTAWIADRAQYCRLYENAGPKIAIGECSTSYMYSAVAAEKIAAVCPHAKVIAILRSPAERAFSHYMMDRRIGITTKTFREELLRESRDPDANWGNSRLYLALGRYAEQLARYFDCFPREQIMILGSDELRADGSATLARVCRFLGVGPQVEAQGEAVAPVSENAAALSRFPAVNRVLHKTRLKRRLRAALPASARRWLRGLYFVDAGIEPLDPADRQLVDELLGEEPMKLATLLAGDRLRWLDEQQLRTAATAQTGKDSWR